MKSLQLLLCQFVISALAAIPIQSMIDIANAIQQNITNSQFKHGTPYNPPFTLQQIQGLYPSFISANFFGGPEMQDLRHNADIVDNNMFVTAWVIEILLQVFQEGIIKIDQSQIDLAISALGTFQDKNYNSGSGIEIFWQQKLENGTWVAYPENMMDSCNQIPGCNTSTTMLAFRIPSDADDSGVNLAIGGILQQLQNSFPTSVKTWNQNNNNISMLMSTIKQYAYRPFSSEYNQNTIDTRTYFFLQDFLQQEWNSSSQPDVRLVTTWFQNIDEVRTGFYSGYAMPFNENNVDATVGSNFIYGITRAVMSDIQNPSSWFDSDLQSIYLDTAEYIAWTINSGRISERPDLGLTYYPPFYDVLWMAARTVAFLATSPPPSFSVIKQAANTLQAALEKGGWSILSNTVQRNQNGYAYWDDFLGAADTDVNGNPINSADDRIFSTAIAVNSLIDTWTQWNSAGCRVWPSSINSTIPSIVEGAILFLTNESLGENFRPDNAFFSGSVKTSYDLPFYYPSNFNQFLNGTDYLTPNAKNAIEDFGNGDFSELISAVSGFINATTYSQLLQLTWYSRPVPETFKGYNQFPGELFFWNSHPLTYSVVLLALSKYIGMEMCSTSLAL